MYCNNNYEYFSPSEVIMGFGCFKKVGVLASSIGSKAMIVTDSYMSSNGTIEEVIKSLGQYDVDAVVYNKVNEEPTTEFVDEGSQIYAEHNCDLLIAVGGGSPIDAAKAIGIVAKYQRSIKEFEGINKVPGRGVPVIAIPSTAGTGSEVTRVAIISDKTVNIKLLILSKYLVPAVAICDPELTLSMPKILTAATGLDALTHAIEAYISVKAQPFTDTIALESIRLISSYLRQAWSNPADLVARDRMMIASTMAGLAFSNSSVALVHGMSRPIGACFHVPHGLSNAVLLPTVMRFTLPGNIAKFARIAEAMGEVTTGISLMNAGEKAVSSVESLCRDLNMLGLQNAGISQEELQKFAPKMARDAIASGSPANNPRCATEEEIIDLYMKSY